MIKKYFSFLVFCFIFLMFFFLFSFSGFTKAAEPSGKFVSDEKLVSAEESCGVDFEEKSVFFDGASSPLRHCVKYEQFSQNGFFLSDSFFESGPTTSESCIEGERAGIFSDGEFPALLCIKKIQYTGSQSLVSEVKIVEGENCPADFSKTSVTLKNSQTLSHCVKYFDNSKTEGRMSSRTNIGAPQTPNRVPLIQPPSQRGSSGPGCTLAFPKKNSEPKCGDGKIEGQEECDFKMGEEVFPYGKNNCKSLGKGYNSGTLKCYPPGNEKACKIDESDCSKEPVPGQACKEIENWRGEKLDCGNYPFCSTRCGDGKCPEEHQNKKCPSCPEGKISCPDDRRCCDQTTEYCRYDNQGGFFRYSCQTKKACGRGKFECQAPGSNKVCCVENEEVCYIEAFPGKQVKAFCIKAGCPDDSYIGCPEAPVCCKKDTNKCIALDNAQYKCCNPNENTKYCTYYLSDGRYDHQTNSCSDVSGCLKKPGFIVQCQTECEFYDGNIYK